jgi:sugar phosphate permease
VVVDCHHAFLTSVALEGEPEETMTTFKPSPQMRRMQILALLLLVASGIVNYLDRSALSIANIEVRQELGLSATAMGVLLSAFLMSYAFSQLPAGILVDRVGPRILLGAGLVIWSLAQGAAGFVTSYTQFFAARIGLGVGESPQFPTGARVVSNWFQVKERGFPTGIFNAAPSIGTALAPPILTWLMLAYGWRVMSWVPWASSSQSRGFCSTGMPINMEPRRTAPHSGRPPRPLAAHRPRNRSLPPPPAYRR